MRRRSLPWRSSGRLAQAEAVLIAADTSGAMQQELHARLVQAARAELALARGDAGQALEIVEQLIASAANVSEQRVIPRLWKLRGEALAALGNLDEAEPLLHAAHEAARTQGLRSLLWRVQLALGKLYRAQRRSDEAEDAFAHARALVEELAANVPDTTLRATFVQRASALLPMPRPLSPLRAAKQAFGGLTARERQVAALIARGLTSRQIAEELVITEGTVAVHVEHILGKLGFRSRAQIAAWATDKGLAKSTE
jgi:DNA-binding CsgD family transcriptional regulator